jgi:hypothetical protein
MSLWSSHAAKSLRSPLLFAGFVLSLAGAAKLAARLGLMDEADLARRVGMVTIGLLLAFIGNSIPKTLAPLSEVRCDPSKHQAFQRWSGWVWLIAGLGYAVVWLVAPLDVAAPLSMLVVGVAMALVLARLVRLKRAGQRAA